MNKELQIFLSVIDVIMESLNENSNVDQLESIRLPIVLQQEIKIVKGAFQKFLLNPHEQYHLTRITKKYHDTIADLSNNAFKLYQQLSIGGNTSSEQNIWAKDIYLLIVMQLEELLQSINMEQSLILSELLTVSNYHTDLHSQHLEAQFLRLDHQWSGVEIDRGLVDLLQGYFFSFRSKGSLKWNYSQIEYAENLVSELLSRVEFATATQWNNHIWHQLIKYNFNKTEILDYAKYSIKKQAKSYRNSGKAYNFILLTLKNIRQVAKNVLWHYLPNALSLQAYLEVILLEELAWLQKHYPQLNADHSGIIQERIFMNSSREEINLFTILSIKMRKIENEDPEQVMTILSQFVSAGNGPDDAEYRFKKDFSEIDFETVKEYNKYLISYQQQLLKEYPQLRDFMS